MTNTTDFFRDEFGGYCCKRSKRGTELKQSVWEISMPPNICDLLHLDIEGIAIQIVMDDNSLSNSADRFTTPKSCR